MAASMRADREVGYEGILCPDHVPVSDLDPARERFLPSRSATQGVDPSDREPRCGGRWPTGGRGSRRRSTPDALKAFPGEVDPGRRRKIRKLQGPDRRLASPPSSERSAGEPTLADPAAGPDRVAPA